MHVFRTISELGLEQGAVAVWAEPRSGQALKPKFGSRYFQKKPLYAAVIVGAIFASSVGVNGYTIPFLWFIAIPIMGVVISWPLAVAVDRLNKRNVWVYLDYILISHAKDRTVVRKADLKEIHVYDTKIQDLRAVEFLTHKGKSTVIGLPSEVVLSDFFNTLRDVGYPVSDDL